MFSFFKKKTPAEKLLDAIIPKPTALPPLPERQVEADQPVYQIGKTPNGKTTLRMQNNYGHTTLTMNNDGVDQLIRMLEAAKDLDEDKEDTV